MIRQNSCNEKKAVHITFSIHTENTYYQISEYFSTDLLSARKKKDADFKIEKCNLRKFFDNQNQRHN